MDIVLEAMNNSAIDGTVYSDHWDEVERKINVLLDAYNVEG